MTETTTNLSLLLLDPGQAQKEITINEALAAIDALLNRGAADKDLATPPTTPAVGDLYIVAASPSGAWAGHAGHVAYFDQIWRFLVSNEGMTLWVNDEDALYAFNGTSWVRAGSGDTVAMLGIEATPDSTNRLSVKSDAVLFDHHGGDARVKVNKAAAGNTASHLFQTAYSGRAEFGLTGDDHFHIKVSPDGSSWNNALTINKTTAALTPGNLSGTRIGFNLLRGIVRNETQLLIEAFTTAPKRKRTFLIDDLVGALVDAGIWAKLDVFYAMAAADTQAARVNWKAPGIYTLTAYNSPIFTTDVGYTGNGTSAYLDTGFNPSTAGGNYALNAAHVGLWVNTITSASGRDLGSSTTSLRLSTGTECYMVNAGAERFYAATNTAPAFLVSNRSVSTDASLYVNGTLAETTSATSTALSNTLMIGGGVAGLFSDRQWSFMCAGSALTAPEIAALHTAVAAYRTGL